MRGLRVGRAAWKGVEGKLLNTREAWLPQVS